MPLVALTRAVPSSLNRCQLTHLDRVPIDLQRAQEQHEQYESVLQFLGCELERIPAAMDLPDSVFVEDTAVVLDELAIITRPGAESRRPETEDVAFALAPYRPLAFIVEPATLDGGDVLRIGKRIYVGLTGRSNHHAVDQLARLAACHGYEVTPVEARGCLHLKSAVSAAADDTIVVNPDWVDPGLFRDCRAIDVDPSEPHAANVLRANGAVVCSDAAPRTAERLRRAGFTLRTVPVSELAKAEAGVTCCSLVFEARAARLRRAAERS